MSPACLDLALLVFFSRGHPSGSSLIQVSTLVSGERSSAMKMGAVGSSKRRLSSRGLGGAIREQRARLYIIRRCVVMLLCWHD
ncbi:hypothetical protein EJ110_NYTH36862 [Nymphaea thermarum]|nr:hypothetical protein EJ110_NYTH36862 [Nymphaea thermarum]